MRLPNLEGYLKFPGPLPVTGERIAALEGIGEMERAPPEKAAEIPREDGRQRERGAGGRDRAAIQEVILKSLDGLFENAEDPQRKWAKDSPDISVV